MAEEEVAGTGPMENNNTTTEAETGGQGKKKKARRMAGKYTKKLDNASTVGGAELELASSMHCARWLKKTGHFQRPSKWKGS